MDKEQFLRNIQEEDNNSLRTGAANRILQLLQRQRYNNNEDSVKRWIWELCQNAKDVCNDSGKVKIRIDLDESNKRVIFQIIMEEHFLLQMSCHLSINLHQG